LNNFENVKFAFDAMFFKMIYLPLIFWLCWAVPYYILTTTILSRYVYNSDTYGSGIADFTKVKSPLNFILGDVERNRQLKYIIQHFVFFVVSMPLAILSFYSFEFNCVYLFSIILFISWNTGRNNLRHIQRKLDKIEAIAEKGTTDEEN
jgi:hypothetical protein